MHERLGLRPETHASGMQTGVKIGEEANTEHALMTLPPTYPCRCPLKKENIRPDGMLMAVMDATTAALKSHDQTGCIEAVVIRGPQPVCTVAAPNMRKAQKPTRTRCHTSRTAKVLPGRRPKHMQLRLCAQPGCCQRQLLLPKHT